MISGLLVAMVVGLVAVEPPPPPSPLPPVLGPDRLLRELPVERPDNTPASTTVYLPPGYRANTERRYPVLILLHGLQGAGADWIDRARVDAILDTAIASGEIEPLIAIMPNGEDGYWVDWPDDQPGHQYSSLVEPDLTTWADAHFRTDGRRAIAGLSMGGFGALSIALRTPKRFSAAISLSGALFEKPPSGRKVYLAAFGAPGPSQWRFAFWNPLDLIRLGQADGMAVWLDCGADDRAKFTRGLAAVSRALTRRGIEHVARLRPGKHSWQVWIEAFTETLPWLQRQWGRARP